MEAENLATARVVRDGYNKNQIKMVTNLALDEGSQGEVIEQISEVLPDVGSTVLAQALIVESVPR
jgi:CRISPR/Cas system-associated protein endoribonuclease Cas2